jgi:hypothetical protein
VLEGDELGRGTRDLRAGAPRHWSPGHRALQEGEADAENRHGCSGQHHGSKTREGERRVICPFAIIKYGFRPNAIIKMGFAATPFSIIVQQTKCHFIPSAHYNLRPFNAVNCTNKRSVRKLAHRLFQPRFKKNPGSKTGTL